MFDVITVGGATEDIYLESNEFNKFQNLGMFEKTEIDKEIYSTGGGGTNSAVSFSRLGLKTGYLGIVGKDSAGSEIKKVLKQNHVSTEFIQTDKKEKTAFSIILLSPAEKRMVLVCRNVEENLDLSEIELKNLKAKWFYITSLGGNFKLLKKIINHATQNNIKIALNPGEKELEKKDELINLLGKINILILNKEEAENFAGSENIENIIKNIYKSFRGICVITLGSKGAIATNGNILFEIKTEPKKDAKDSTGAGDAFGSAFTTGIILKNDIEYGLQLGVANSRSVLTSIGAKNGLLKKIPTRFEYKITNNKL